MSGVESSAEPCRRHDLGAREYVCRCEPTLVGDSGLEGDIADDDAMRKGYHRFLDRLESMSQNDLVMLKRIESARTQWPANSKHSYWSTFYEADDA